jgi:hypothetical protein
MAIHKSSRPREEPYREGIEHVLLFDTYAEFIRACDASKASQGANLGFAPDNTGFNWYASKTYPEAYKLASEGWKSGADKLRLQLDKIDVSSYVKKPETAFDVYGDYGFDMGKVMSGEPECMMTLQESEELADSSDGPIIKMVVNTVLSASIPVEVVMRRGAAICAIIDALETSGKQVELTMVCSAWCGSQCFTHIVPLKNPGEPLQIDQIAFSIGHPSIERRFNFIALNLFDAWSITTHSYGSPCDIQESAIAEVDIYFPQMHGSEEQWQSVEACQEWIKARIHDFGIKFEGE